MTHANFGWHGWLLVVAIFLAFFVVPWSIIALPAAQQSIGSVGLSFRDAYLVLPLLPSLGLGALAVWAAVRSRRADD